MKKTLQTITAGLTALAVLAILQTVPTHAASFAVATGNDENTDNSSCSLTEAIENINDQAATNTDCPAGDGVNDTINIPAGTITLTADLPQITESVKVAGADMADTIIDGDSAHRPFVVNSPFATFEISSVKIQNYFKLAVESINGNVALQDLDVFGGGVNPGGSNGGGIILGNNSGSSNEISINNVTIHDFNLSSGYIHTMVIWSTQGSTTNASVKNVTLANIINNTGGINGFATGVGLMDPTQASGEMNLSASNLTVDGLSAPSAVVGAINVVSFSATGDATANINIVNTTVTDTVSGTNQFSATGSLLVGSAGIADGTNASANLTSTNLISSENIFDGAKGTCGESDLTSLFSGQGSASNSITSGGGNLSDDTTCYPYFTQPTDQNNLTNLGSTLGSLQNNGGIVPTRALLNGSPAIDSGITIPGLTQDARGSVRPQGLAYDSGAYESPFTTAQSSTPVKQAAQTLADTGESRRIFILCAVLVVLTSLSVIVAIKRQKKPQK